MGQCPINIPEDDGLPCYSKDLDDVANQSLPDGCFKSGCDPHGVVNITLSKYDEHRFLVMHQYGAQNLIRKDKIEKVFEKEILKHVTNEPNATSSSVDFDETKTDVTTTTVATDKISNSDKYRTKGGHLQSNSKQMNAALTEKTGGLKQKLLMQHNERLDTLNEQNANERCNMGSTCETYMIVEPDYTEDIVLHLKMSAKFVDFYESHYKKIFPDSGLMKGIFPPKRKMARKKGSILDQISENGVPALVPSGSSESKSTSSTQGGNRILLESDGSAFLSLAIDGTLGLSKKFDDVRSKTSAQKDYLVLADTHTGENIAICKLKSIYGPPIIHLYAREPITQGQRPTSNLSIKDKPFYSWAEFRIEGEFPLPVRHEIYMATDDGTFEKSPRFRGNHTDVGQPNIQMVGRTEKETSYTGCCLLTLKSPLEVSEKRPYYSLMTSRGTDPALFICMASIVDEMLESTMRQQYRNEKRNEKKRIKNAA